jgi:hypothetical protein
MPLRQSPRYPLLCKFPQVNRAVANTPRRLSSSDTGSLARSARPAAMPLHPIAQNLVDARLPPGPMAQMPKHLQRSRCGCAPGHRPFWATARTREGASCRHYLAGDRNLGTLELLRPLRPSSGSAEAPVACCRALHFLIEMMWRSTPRGSRPPSPIVHRGGRRSSAPSPSTRSARIASGPDRVKEGKRQMADIADSPAHSFAEENATARALQRSFLSATTTRRGSSWSRSSRPFSA